MFLNVCLLSQVSESSFKDHGAIFENMNWDIFEGDRLYELVRLAFTLAGYLSAHSQSEAKSAAGEK